MKTTPLRGYPYPQCAPPLVKDAADLPLQLKNLAEAMDDDIAALQAPSQAAASPPYAKLSTNALPAVARASGSPVVFNTVEFQNGSMADLPQNRIVLNSTGLWLFTGGYMATTSAAMTSFQLNLIQNGQTVHSVSMNQAAIFGVNITLLWVGLGNAGDAVSLVTVFPTGTATETTGALSASRVVTL